MGWASGRIQRIMRQVELREATEEDCRFLYALHCQALKPYVEQTWGWDEAWQHQYFRQRFDPSTRQIIQVGGDPIGSLSVEDRTYSLFIAYIALLPAYQGQGIGTQLIRHVLEEATQRGVPVTLTVLKVNPARTLYERLGFRITATDEQRYFMEAPAVVRANKAATALSP